MGASTGYVAPAVPPIPLSLIDAASDLVVGTADNAVARLAVPASRVPLRKATGQIIAGTTAELAALFGTPDGTKFLKDDGTLAVPAGGGGSGTAFTTAVPQNAHGFAVGDVAYLTAANTYAKAKADSAVTAEVAGIVSAVADVNNFTLMTRGLITGLSGLTAAAMHFLSPTVAGGLTATEPTASGQVSKPLLLARDTTSGYWFNYRGATLVGTGGEVTATDLNLTGLTGATNGGRFVGFVAGAAPTTGTFQAKDWAFDNTLGCMWVCTVGGTPGTWVRAGASGQELAYVESAAFSTVAVTNVLTDIAGFSLSPTVGTRPIYLEAYLPSNLITWTSAGARIRIAILEGATQLNFADTPGKSATSGTNIVAGSLRCGIRLAPTAGVHTYKVQIGYLGGATGGSYSSAATFPAFFRCVEN